MRAVWVKRYKLTVPFSPVPMRSLLLFFSVFLPFACTAADQTIRIPASFEYNAGQASSDVVFLSRSFLSGKPVPTIHLTREGFRLSTPSGRLSFQFAGANRNAEITGVDPQPGHSNYFAGKEPSRWKTGVPSYAKVRYKEIYRGVDLIFYRHDGELEYDLLLHPGADARSIRLSLTGNGTIQFDSSGNLIFGTAVLHQPVVYQMRDGKRHSIRAGFRRSGSHEVVFALAAYA